MLKQNAFQVGRCFECFLQFLDSKLPKSENEIGKSNIEIYFQFEMEIFYCKDGCLPFALNQPEKESSVHYLPPPFLGSSLYREGCGIPK